MFEEIIKRIEDSVTPQEVVINGVAASSRPVYPVEQPRCSTIETSTLQSISTYIAELKDEVAQKGGGRRLFIHISGPGEVSVCVSVNDDRRREEPIRAAYIGSDILFGRAMDQGTFITMLRSQFVPSDEREKLQKLAGSLVADSSVQLQDDGIAQTTVAKRGVSSFERVDTAGTFTLAPFRSFPEIEQPESEFIVRLHRRNEDGAVPLISLHEADNHAWRNEAIARIAAWLRKEGGVPAAFPILA